MWRVWGWKRNALLNEDHGTVCGLLFYHKIMHLLFSFPSSKNMFTFLLYSVEEGRKIENEFYTDSRKIIYGVLKFMFHSSWSIEGDVESAGSIGRWARKMYYMMVKLKPKEQKNGNRGKIDKMKLPFIATHMAPSGSRFLQLRTSLFCVS